MAKIFSGRSDVGRRFGLLFKVFIMFDVFSVHHRFVSVPFGKSFSILHVSEPINSISLNGVGL